MCLPSHVAPDWVEKGCHIHIGHVELRVYPDHDGSVGFAPFFSTPLATANGAIKIAREVCLPDPEVRKRWVRSLRAATAYMLGVTGSPREKALGRMAEFKFLEVALNDWKPNG